MIYVLIWFDVEDYFSAASDDADLRAAEIASNAGVPVTVKVVGEKARALERNGRQDVIRALARHSVGYHSDWHSRPPTIAAYLSGLGWEEGAAEFEQRERQGFEDVRRIFNRDPSCFGQPGMSWAPQIYPVLKKWKIGVYLDEAAHVGLPNEQPFWFQGMLHVFNLRRNAIKMEFGSAADFQRTCKQFQSAYERLSRIGDGLISLYYHPQEFVYRDFSDELNFGRGADSGSEWKTCEQRALSEIKAAYEYYARLLHFIGSFEAASFIDADQLLNLYGEPKLPEDQPLPVILALAAQVRSEITFQQVGDFCLSPAEAFGVLIQWLGLRVGLPADVVRGNLRVPIGPTSEGRAQGLLRHVDWSDFQSAVVRTACFLKEQGQIPSSIRIGDQCASPQDFLANMGQAITWLVTQGYSPSSMPWQSGNFTADQYAAEDSPELWAWPIFPSGFQSPNLMRLARLQTWTIKPAKPQPNLFDACIRDDG